VSCSGTAGPCPRRWTAHLFLLLISLAIPVRAQVGTANVIGVVVDSTNARIPGAQIKLLNTQTGAENDSTTNEVGVFALAGILPGNYILEVARDGFATAQFTGIILNVGDSREFLIRMQVGPVDQTVTIDAAGLTANTGDASVSTVVERRFVSNIPLNGRSFQDLITMTPGVLSQTPQAFGRYGQNRGDFSVNGQGPDKNEYTVDGISANTNPGILTFQRKLPSAGDVASTTALGTTQSLASVDALEEFRTLGSTYSAEYGRTPGGQFTLATRSGTNEFHGSIYDYIRNNIFDSTDRFTGVYGALVDVHFRQDDFGAVLGGPVVLPHLYKGRDRTFFFLSQENLYVSQPTAPLIEYVPSYEVRFSAPAGLRPVLNAFPIPGQVQVVVPPGSLLTPATYASQSWPSRIHAVSARLDHQFSQKWSSFFRYSDTPSRSQSRVLSSLTISRLRSRSFTLGVSNQIFSSLSQDFRMGYTSTHASLHTSIDNNFQTSSGLPENPYPDLNKLMGVPEGYASVRAEAYIHLPGLGESAIHTDAATSHLSQWNFRDTVSLQAGHHFLRFGIDERHLVSAIAPPAVTLEADFLSSASVASNRPSSVSITKSEPSAPVFNEFAAFAQDEWRIARPLTLSLGLRWDVDPPPGEAHGQHAYTVKGDPSHPASLRLAPRGTPLWHTSWYNFAPRAGAAWVIDNREGQELVLRAGAGAFFDTDNGAAVQAFGAYGFSTTVTASDGTIPVSPAQFEFSADPNPPSTSAAALLFPSHLQLPYALQWNVALEKALGRSQTFTTSYVGASGRRQLQSQRIDLKGANPQFGELLYFPGNITSNYQSLQAKFQRSIASGLEVLGSYTWSHTLDYGSTDSFYPLTYGTSNFDVRHNVQAAFTWDTPRLAGRGALGNVLGNWGVDGRVTVRSAFPVTLLGNLSIDPNTGERYYSGVDLLPGRPFYLHGADYPGGRSFNGGPTVSRPAFVLPQVGQPGDAPRNLVRGFWDYQINLGLRRSLPLYRTVNLQLGAEAFNLLNHPDLGYIDPDINDQLFGRATLSLNQSYGPGGSLYQPGGPRSLQFMVKFTF
jgi:hypothetical protein